MEYQDRTKIMSSTIQIFNIACKSNSVTIWFDIFQYLYSSYGKYKQWI